MRDQIFLIQLFEYHGINSGLSRRGQSPLESSPPGLSTAESLVPPDQISQPYLVPLLPTVPPAADCSLFAIAFATALAYGEQPGHCLFDQIKVRQHQLTSLQALRGDDTTPIEEKSA